jgi:hypothetical protein
VAAETPTPLGDGVGGAAELGGDLLVGGLVGLGTTEDETAAEGEALGSRVGLNEAAEVDEFVGGENDTRRFAGHGRDSGWAEARG